MMLVLTIGNIYAAELDDIFLKNGWMGENLKRCVYDVGDLYTVPHQRLGNLVSMARNGDMAWCH